MVKSRPSTATSAKLKERQVRNCSNFFLCVSLYAGVWHGTAFGALFVLFCSVIIPFILLFSSPSSSSSSSVGYETTIGFLDVKTHSSGVSFYVQRNSSYSSAGTVIPYEVTRLNVGGHMNAATGVFTAPVNGRYQFSFTARSFSSGVKNFVFLRVNGARIAISGVLSKEYNLPMVATLQLTKGETVDVYLNQGSIYDNSAHDTQFSGFLLEEDLVLWSKQRRAMLLPPFPLFERAIWLIDSLCCALLFFSK